jgi:diguanylate cyclase (GGDEF)-like protein
VLPDPRPLEGGRVLVVDDSAIVRRIVAARLRGDGFTTIEAVDGREAVDRLRREAFDVVVTDLHMPGLDGLGLLDHVRSEGLGPEVIVLTGGGAEEVERARGALGRGAHSYVVKGPASAEAVSQGVRSVLESRRRPPEDLGAAKPLPFPLRDSLTGLPNRRALGQALARELERAREAGRPLSILLAVLDRFEEIGEAYGREAAAAALRHLARLASRLLRGADALHRGGEGELAALLPQTPVEGALQAARRLVEQVAASPVDVGKAVLSLTCSVACFGAAGMPVAAVESRLAAAAAGLAEAGRAGRRRVVVQLPEPPVPAGR